MSGRVRPKRMSVGEADGFIASPAPPEGSPWDEAVPVQRDQPEPDEEFFEEDERPEAVVEMVAALQAAGVDLAALGVATSTDAPSTAVHDPVDAAPEPLRPLDAIEADIDEVCGVRALSNPSEYRHEVTLRLLDDLIDARLRLDDYERLVALIQKGQQ